MISWILFFKILIYNYFNKIALPRRELEGHAGWFDTYNKRAPGLRPADIGSNIYRTGDAVPKKSEFKTNKPPIDPKLRESILGVLGVKWVNVVVLATVDKSQNPFSPVNTIRLAVTQDGKPYTNDRTPEATDQIYGGWNWNLPIETADSKLHEYRIYPYAENYHVGNIVIYDPRDNGSDSSTDWSYAASNDGTLLGVTLGGTDVETPNPVYGTNVNETNGVPINNSSGDTLYIRIKGIAKPPAPTP